MTQRIFVKLILMFGGLLVLAALGMDYLVKRVVSNNMRGALEQVLKDEAVIAKSVFANRPVEQYSGAAADISRETGIRVTVIEPGGEVLADTDADPATMANHATRPEFVEALEGRVGVSSRVSQTTGDEFLYVATPLDEGALRLALPLSVIETRIREIRSKTLGVTLLALVPAIAAAAWLSRRLSERLSQVMQFSNRLAHGDFRSPAPPFSGGELGALWRSLDTAAEHLRNSFEQLRQERSRIDAVVNAISEGILVVDEHRRLMLFNPAMNKLLPDEPLKIGASLDDWARPEVPGLFGRVLFDGEGRSINLVLKQPTERVLKVSCAPIERAGHKRQAAVAVFYDITELERVDRMRRDFVANVSHELRTPLASVRGFAETLLDGAIEDPEHSRRFVEIIRQNAERLTRLTSDLMTLSQIEIKAREFEFTSHPVHRLLSQAADSVLTLAEPKHISVEVDPVPPELEVECDAQAIHQALSNLLDNAVKYTPEGGSIRLGACLAGDEVDFYVKDTGAGIPPEHMPRLFERFYRVDKARSRALGGTGLGLAIVKHLVLAHRGSVRAESVVGQGSTFYFRIPLRIKNREGETLEELAADIRQRALF